MPLARSLQPQHPSKLMHEGPSYAYKGKLAPKPGSLQRGQSDNYQSLRPEAVNSNLLRGSSADLSEFIWPKDHRPSVPHNDFERAQELPTVDLAGLQPGKSERERARIAKHLVKTLSDWGFAQVINHGVPTDVTAKMQSQARKFFDLPLEQKERGVASSTSKHEGFGYGVESGFYYAGKPWIDRFQCRWSPVCEIREPVEKVFSSDDAEEFRYLNITTLQSSSSSIAMHFSLLYFSSPPLPFSCSHIVLNPRTFD